MEQNTTYEGMFVLEPGTPDFEQASQPVRTVLDRSGAEVLLCKPWDDRRLAYEIKGKRRGLYVLTYFRAEPDRIREIEHDCQLSEEILRVLILQRGDLTPEAMEEEAARTASPGESGGRGDRDRDRGPRGRDRSETREKDTPKSEDEPKPKSEGEGDDEPEPRPEGKSEQTAPEKPEGESKPETEAESQPAGESASPSPEPTGTKGEKPQAGGE